MPGFYADLHVHSKYSRATSRDADLEHFALWARRKGLTVVGTGDFTHPAWFEEIRDKLVPAEPGLFRLRPEIERAVDSLLPPSCQGPTRFLLEVEISTIYKKGERTRKVHHLLYAASLDTAARMRAKLGAIGNLAADGRPILGLDSRHLLEITLESGPDAFLIPAHVWTPWFAVLGSKSGFDSVEECYGDLSSQIFAIETGLSSDPPMNWRVSKLDRFRLVSNSDAHSPPMLGREATAFDTDLDYFALRRALETGAGLSGTLEFFPEEGKYHLDGHRTCGVRLEPGATREAGGLCPACGKPLTVGVLHRVEELADRPEGFTPNRAESFRCLVPLPEVISELCGTGVKSRAVEQEMTRLITRLGPEIDILERLPLEEVARAGDGLLSEALTRLRAGKVHRDAGYDGEYGVIRLFEPGEIRRRAVVAPLFAPGAPEPPPADRPAALAFRPGNREKEGTSADARAAPRVNPPQHGSVLDALDPEQRAAAEVTEGALLLVAGPGTGKTRTLTHRLAHLTVERGVAAERCLAVTFSRRAAAEMAERLDALMPAAVGRPLVATFHGLGLRLLSEQSAAAGLAPGFRVATPAERLAIARDVFAQPPARLERLLADISRHRRLVQAGAPPPEPSSIGSGGPGGPGGPGDPSDHAARYEAALASRNLLDFDDLLLRPLALLQDNPALVALYRERFTQISIDEYQDIDPLQYALVKLLAPPGGNLCAIGDPDQSIYSFRGADVGFFLRFSQDWPGARVLHLTRNYRSTSTLVAAACQAIRPGTLVPGRRLIAVREGGSSRIGVERAAAERAEAELVVHTLEKLLDGTSSFSFDSGRVGHGEAPSLAFSDIAILYRTEAQVPPLAEALGRAGIPFARRSHRPLAEHPGVRALIDHLAAAEETAEERTESVESRLDRAVGELSRAETAAEPAQASADLLTHLRAGAELLRSLASRSGDDLQRFLTEVALGAEIDTWDPRAERVSLLTLHAAKGLEFQVVFLVGCEDGLLPLTFPEVREADRAEERRLFFVGITRARSRLYLFHSRRRTVYGAAREARPSPFLADLADDLLELGEERAAPGPRQSQLRLLFPP